MERGYQPSTRWLYIVGATALVALGGALAAMVSAGRSLWWRRIRWRVTGGSGLGMRASAASRAWLITACAASLGGTAGGVSGLLIAWPVTTPIGWDPLPRVAFDLPWLPIAAAVAALPLVTAALAALLPPGSPDSE